MSEQNYTQANFPYKGIETNAFFKTSLQPHQREIVEWMKFREHNMYEGIRGCLNFSEMGTGKTLCALSLIVLEGGYTLVIAPAGLVGVWQSEIRKHFTDDVTFFAYYGNNRKRMFEKYRLDKGDPQIIIMSYQSILTDIDDAEGPLHNIQFDRIVYDECHYIKNNLTNTFRAVERVRAPKKMFLSGSPLMNRVEELYPYLKLLNYVHISRVPNQQFNRQHFTRTFVTGRQGFIDLQNLLKVIAIRRTKDILNLPTKTWHDTFINFSDEERDFYNALKFYSKIRVKKLLRNINNIRASWIPWNEQGKLRLIVLQTLLSLIFHLRVACCDVHLVIDKIPRLAGKTVKEASVELWTPHTTTDCPVCYNAVSDTTCTDCGHRACNECWEKLAKLTPMRCLSCLETVEKTSLVRDAIVVNDEDERKHHDYRLFYRSTKTTKVMNLVKEELEKGNKVIVVSQWTTYLDILHKQFVMEFPDVGNVLLNGKTVPMKRQKFIDQFQEDNTVKVAFASLGSSAEGVTLTASCSMVIAEPFWNMAKMNQMSDRIHRIGQDKPVNVWTLYVSDTIEGKVRELILKKDEVCKIITECKAVTVQTENIISRVIKFTE